MIVLPTPAPIACSVVPPSAISEDEAGHRPLTTVGCADPRTACVTNTFAPTECRRDRSVTKFRRPAAVIEPTCGSRSRSASVSPALPYGFPASYCQPTPYRRGGWAGGGGGAPDRPGGAEGGAGGGGPPPAPGAGGVAPA